MEFAPSIWQGMSKTKAVLLAAVASFADAVTPTARAGAATLDAVASASSVDATGADDGGGHEGTADHPGQGQVDRIETMLAGEFDISPGRRFAFRVGIALEALEQGQSGIGRAGAVEIFPGIGLPQPPWDGGDAPPSLRDARTTDPAHPFSLASPSLSTASLREEGSLGR